MKDNILSKLSWSFASKYRTTIILWAVLLIFGALSYTTFLKKEGFPPINLPIGAVQGTYFVDDADKVDFEVTQPVSRAIESIDNVKSYDASSGDNFYSILITFNDDVQTDDGVSEVKAALDGLVLPNGAESTVAGFDPSKFDNKYNLLLAVYENKDSNYTDLAAKAQLLAEDINGVEEVVSAEAVSVLETVTDPETNSPVERQTSINKIAVTENGKTTFYPAITVGVTKADDVDDIQLSNAVSAVLDEGNNNGTKTSITADFATTIDKQIGSLQNSLIGGLIAVVLVALLLISWRAALVIALFIPTVLAATFAGLFALGITLNTITLFAVILTLGLFVDDATIIVEAIDSHRRDGKNHKDIIKKAVSRVGIASLAGTLTTLLVFAPMLFVSGILGSFIKLLPITVILALSVSFIISILLVPFLTRPFVLSGKKKKRGFLDRLSILVPVEKFLANKLSKLPLMNRDNPKKGRKVTSLMVGLSIVAMIGAGGFASQLPLDIFPQSKDSDILQASVEFAPGTTVAEAESITEKIDTNIEKAIGSELTYVTYVAANERSATIEIGLTSFNDREQTSHDLIAELETTGLTIDGSEIKYSQRDAGPPTEEFPYQMRVYARDEATLTTATDQITSFMSAQSFVVSGKDVKVEEVKTSNNGTINRTDRGRFSTLSAKFNNTDVTSPAVAELERLITDEFTSDKLVSLSLKSDALDFDVSQESENADSFGSIGIGLVIALALMYLLLVVLFNSFSQPLLIFTAIPFSLFGVFFGLSITGNSLSFFVMLGLLGLIGIVVNNTILLTEYANQEREAGADRWTAISNAVKDRFRPLVTTTITTVFALLPLALSDPFWQSLAYTLIFGMISSTTLIILSFPYYYLFVERIREWKNNKLPALK